MILLQQTWKDHVKKKIKITIANFQLTFERLLPHRPRPGVHQRRAGPLLQVQRSPPPCGQIKDGWDRKLNKCKQFVNVWPSEWHDMCFCRTREIFRLSHHNYLCFEEISFFFSSTSRSFSSRSLFKELYWVWNVSIINHQQQKIFDNPNSFQPGHLSLPSLQFLALASCAWRWLEEDTRSLILNLKVLIILHQDIWSILHFPRKKCCPNYLPLPPNSAKLVHFMKSQKHWCKRNYMDWPYKRGIRNSLKTFQSSKHCHFLTNRLSLLTKMQFHHYQNRCTFLHKEHEVLAYWAILSRIYAIFSVLILQA